MNKIKPYINIVIIVFAFLLFQKSFLVMLANVSTLFRENNKNEILESSYKLKIETLEKRLSDYELALNNLKITPNSSYVLAKISLRNTYNFYDFIIISADFSVYKNNIVLNEDGVVGIITESDLKTAKVKLLTGTTNLNVKVGNIYGILSDYDKKEKLLKVTNISNYDNVNIGDIVTTSDLSYIEESLPIGKVKKIEEKEIEKIIYVESYVDFDNLNYLYVASKK